MLKPIFIIFNGPPRSGKDTAKDSVARWLKDNYRDTYVANITFSDLMKSSLPILYGIDIDEWNERYNSDAKDEPWDKLFGWSQRQILISYAEEQLKRIHGTDVFPRLLKNKIESTMKRVWQEHRQQCVFLMDVGFDEEFKEFTEMVGKDRCMLIKIERKGCNFSHDSRKYIRERLTTGLMGYYNIINDANNVESWYRKVKDTVCVALNVQMMKVM
jgi:hypothetical protein